VIGQLQVPTLGLDVSVIDNSAGVINAAKLGPALSSDANPSALPVGGHPVAVRA